METAVQVFCSKGTSLRDRIVNDENGLADFDLVIQKKQQPGRRPGWTTIRSKRRDRQGTLKIAWDANIRILICRIENRKPARPHGILGDFVDYLFERCGPRIQSVNIVPR